jgi:hypothetical protein
MIPFSVPLLPHAFSLLPWSFTLFSTCFLPSAMELYHVFHMLSPYYHGALPCFPHAFPFDHGAFPCFPHVFPLLPWSLIMFFTCFLPPAMELYIVFYMLYSFCHGVVPCFSHAFSALYSSPLLCPYFLFSAFSVKSIPFVTHSSFLFCLLFRLCNAFSPGFPHSLP